MTTYLQIKLIDDEHPELNPYEVQTFQYEDEDEALDIFKDITESLNEGLTEDDDDDSDDLYTTCGDPNCCLR